MTRILIMTGATLGSKMAGPAIRALAMARVLTADGHRVTLATTSSLDEDALRGALSEDIDFGLVSLRPGAARPFARLERDSDVIVFQGHAMEQFPLLARSNKVVVADVYDPMHLEMLEQGRELDRAHWDYLVASRVQIMNQQLTRSDHVLCASERQRTLYVGHLASLGRISPSTYESDPELRSLLAVVPFGLDPVPPRASGATLRGVVQGIDDASKIVLWGGGLYSWFDPLVLIRAAHKLHLRRPTTRLVFLGTKTPGIEPMGIVKEAIDLASELGAFGTSVHFNEHWVPFAQRGGFYCEANAGVSTHHTHLETEFSFRTRILDYIWAGLPMVVTEGDGFADLVRQKQLGIVVPAGDVDALEIALEKVLFDEVFAAECARNVDTLSSSFRWESTLVPLREIAANPQRAVDVVRAGGRSRLARAIRKSHRSPLPPGAKRDLVMGLHYLRVGGAAEIRRRLATRKRAAG